MHINSIDAIQNGYDYIQMHFFSSAATRSCFLQDWSNSFNGEGETQCESSSGYYNLIGFERDGTDNLQGIKKAKCCGRDRTFWNTPTICQMPDWTSSMAGKTIDHIRVLDTGLEIACN